MCAAIYCTFTGHGIVLKGMVWYYRSGDANGLTTEHTGHIRYRQRLAVRILHIILYFHSFHENRVRNLRSP